MSARIAKIKPCITKNLPSNNDLQNEHNSTLLPKIKTVSNAVSKPKLANDRPSQAADKRETKVTPPRNTQEKIQNTSTTKDKNVESMNKTNNEQLPLVRNQLIETCPSNVSILNIETCDSSLSNVCNINLPVNSAAYVKVRAIAGNADDNESTSVICKSFTVKNTTKNNITISDPYNVSNHDDGFSGDIVLTVRDVIVAVDSAVESKAESSPDQLSDQSTKIVRQVGLDVIGTQSRIRWFVSLFVMKVDLTPLNLVATNSDVVHEA